MSFHKKTVRDVNLRGKRVLVSVDYNVPGDETGAVTSDERIEASLPTLKYLLDQKCAIVLISHRGRPNGRVVKQFSLKHVVPILSKLLDKPVGFVDDCVGKAAQTAKQALKPGQILLLENTRFHKEEEADDKKFGQALAEGMDVFVQEAFGNAHRKHASTDAVTHFLPSVAGLLLSHEVETILRVIDEPKRPLMAIIGGAKIADKIEVLERFIELADFVAVGGAMANTFLLAEGVDIGASKSDKEDVPLARDLIDKAKAKAKRGNFIFYLPQDGVVAKTIDKKTHTRIVDWDAHVIASIESYPKRPPRVTEHIAKEELILDIGPFSAAFIAGGMQLCNTVIWNGTLGVTETPSLQGPVGPFAHGSELIVEALLGQFGHRPYSLVGGGDTAAYVEQRGIAKLFDHVSTGGGASLELLAGRKLPAVEALQDK